MNKKIYCDLCGRELKLKGNELLDGFQLVFNIGGNKKVKIFRGKECYEKDKTLSNFQECEVYTRVVGYLRPISHFNIGKQQEYKERINFKT